MAAANPEVKLDSAGPTAEALDWPTYTLYREARLKRIPHVRRGRLIFFQIPSLKEWIARGGTPLESD